MKNKLIIVISLFLLIISTKFVVKNFDKNRTVSSEIEAPKTEPSFEFQFRYNKEIFSTSVKSSSQEAAYKIAASECFKFFTKGKYPGEEKGLDIIDSCANPKKGLK